MEQQPQNPLSAEEIVKKHKNPKKDYAYNISHESLLSAMEEYASQQTSSLQKQLDTVSWERDHAEKESASKSIEIIELQKQLEEKEREITEFKRLAVEAMLLDESKSQELKAVREENERLVSGLKNVESLIDNQNHSHENIWRLIHSILNPTQNDTTGN